MKYSRFASYHNDKLRCAHDSFSQHVYLLTGGACPTTQTYKVMIEVTATEPKFIENYEKLTKKLTSASMNVPSFELFSFLINYCDKTKHLIDNSAELNSFAQICYDRIKTSFYLSAKPRLEIDNNAVFKVYAAIDPQTVIRIKNNFVDFLESKLGKTDMKIIKATDENIYHVYSQNGHDLFAIRDDYCSINKWSPKLKLVSIDKINQHIYDTYIKNGQDEFAKYGTSMFANNILLGLHFDKLYAVLTKHAQ